VKVTAVVIGGGHSGLAMSKCLTDRSIDHVVIERGEVAQSWKTQRWDSLRLLTPNWLTRLPGREYDGENPDEFMAMPELIDFIEDYSAAIAAPVQCGTTVTSVSRDENGYQVVTDQGTWACKTVVLASGACNVASIPELAAALPSSVNSVTPLEYRNTGQLADGGVLVVGASATGAQLADEIHRSGRPVTISVGEHVRMPRTYRGRDVQWWMDGAGLLDETLDDVDDIMRARHVPSPQLVGTPERASVDLNTLVESGIELRGRLGGIRDGVAQFSGGFRNHCMLADLKMNRLLNTFDEWADESKCDDVADSHRFEPTRIDTEPPLEMDLKHGHIKTVVWATGFRPDHSWLDVPVFDRKGRIEHDGGVVDSPGMYILGMPFLRRRKSSFIHGAGDDANDLSDHLAGYLDSMAA
jgi:putative flavoprotein involved in K+ transport